MSGWVAIVDLPGQRRFPREELSMFRRFIVEEDAQELMEYVYLCAFIGLVGVLVWNNIVTLLGTNYTSFNTKTQDLWVEPDPP
jgi:Flp pilus assembly pilin Flp